MSTVYLCVCSISAVCRPLISIPHVTFSRRWHSELVTGDNQVYVVLFLQVISPVDTKPPEQPPAAPPPTPASAPINSPPLPAVPVCEPVEPVKTEPAANEPGDDEDPADNAETDHTGSTQTEKDHKMVSVGNCGRTSIAL